MRKFFLLVLPVLCAVAPLLARSDDKTPSQKPPGGHAEPKPSSAKAVGKIAGSFETTEKVKLRGDTSEKDIVFFLEKVGDNEFPAPKKPIEVDQKKLTFIPHVLPVLEGSTVRFKNSDSVKHNIFASDECCKVDQDTEVGGHHDIAFDKAGVSALVCRIHPEMSMFVIVLENPHFTQAELAKGENAEGKRVYQTKFVLDGVPAGKYRLKTWNKRLPPVSIEVEVVDGQTANVELKHEK